MSTYATQKDVEVYLGETEVTDDAFQLERLIQQAERDLDNVIVPLNTVLPPTQVIWLPPDTESGFFTLGFSGQTTGNITYNPTAADIQVALAALSNVGPANVRVVGYGPFTVVWDKGWAQTNYSGTPVFGIPLITVNASSLVPVETPSVTLVPGRRIDPFKDLNENQMVMLSYAVCAQVEYRVLMGSAFFARPQYEQVRGPDFSYSGKLPLIGPKARRELSQSGLMFTAGRAVAGMARRGVARGWATY